MKLKELPKSLWRVWQLKQINVYETQTSSANDLPLVISFTSIPSRLNLIHLTVRSLLVQTRKPERIVLWLHESLCRQIPENLSALCGEKFEIRYASIDCPHLKLVESLKVFPNKVIVTCDDDLLYDPRWLETLYDEHLRYPHDILAHECRLISYDEAGQLKPYQDWKLNNHSKLDHSGILALGYGGVLYPPESLCQDVFNSELYLRLAPKADDLWFKVMAYKQSTRVRKVVANIERALPIAGSQTVSLKKSNVRFDGNSFQWQALVDYFQIPPFVD